MHAERSMRTGYAGGLEVAMPSRAERGERLDERGGRVGCVRSVAARHDVDALLELVDRVADAARADELGREARVAVGDPRDVAADERVADLAPDLVDADPAG